MFMTMLCTGALWLKFFATLVIQGYWRIRAGNRPQEDKKLGLGHKESPFEIGMELDPSHPHSDKWKRNHQMDERWTRIVANDLESIPLALIVAWAAVICRAPAIIHDVLIITYVLSRIGHTYCYAYGIQPGRSISWFAAKLCEGCLLINGLYGALK